MMENRVYYGEYSLAYWIELILTKQIVLPKYQRYYVWSQSKLKTLVNSILNHRFVPPVTIGSFVKDGKRINYIIDGQQRLTSILLAYLNRFPNRDYYKANTALLAGTVDNLDPDDEESSPLDDVLHWRFDNLTDKGSSSEEILKVLNSEQYGLIYNGTPSPIDKNNASKFFLGFSYIVPATEESASQQEYYTKVFRDINQQASPLLLTESRRSLYFLKEGLDEYFEPSFVGEYGVQLAVGPKQQIDFCRYLCFIAAYKKSNNVKKVARGYSYDTEPYITNYINSVVSGEYEDLFGKFTDLYADANFKTQMDLFKDMLTQLDIPKSYNSIINMDVYFFGLVYTILFEKKTLDVARKEDLLTELEDTITQLKGEGNHTAAPAQFQYMRKRITKSIEVYNKYLAV